MSSVPARLHSILQYPHSFDSECWSRQQTNQSLFLFLLFSHSHSALIISFSPLILMPVASAEQSIHASAGYVLSPSSSAFNLTVPSLFFILNAGLVSRAINQCPAGVFSQLICILQARSMIHAALFISTSRAPYMHIKEPTKAFGLAEVEDPCRPAELACMPVCSLLA
jgi:hypothetical protein